jgi:predicted AlkP superfamily phosphohydrolase/phosphomutase
MQHLFMQDFSVARKKRDTAVAKVYASIDEFLGHVLGKDCNLIIVSDHGFTVAQRTFYLNRYLLEKGLLQLKKPTPKQFFLKAAFSTSVLLLSFWPFSSLRGLIRRVGPGRAVRDVLAHSNSTLGSIDMAGSHAFMFSGSGGMRVNQKAPLQEIIETIRNAADPEGKKLVKAIFMRDDIYHGNAVAGPAAPDLIVVPCEDVLLSISHRPASSGIVEYPSKKFGKHAEFGVFMSYGPDFMPHGKLDDISVLDITPTLLSYFGYALPPYIDGKPIPVLSRAGGARSTLIPETRSAIARFLSRNRSASPGRRRSSAAR